MVHFKCRGSFYPFSEIKRLQFPDSLVPWNAQFRDYAPSEYNSPSLQNKPWADPPIDSHVFKWNSLDGNVNRVSYLGPYCVLEGRPLNPEGRTGLIGRGVLGRWGPNHAADPIVTRWKRINGTKVLNTITNLAILQFCAIQRKDCNEWAIPGGMVDPGEQVSVTLRREFLEEAFNSLETDQGKIENDKKMIIEFFETGEEIYKGYADDPRNTDNVWMETVAVNFHDDTGEDVGKFRLQAGDDAKNVRWLDIDKDINLYANHSQFIERVAKLHQAHW